MTTDDLTAPLGLTRPPKKRFSLARVLAPAAAVALGLSIAVFAGWAVIVDDPLGGEPMAVVTAAAPADASEPLDVAGGATTTPAAGIETPAVVPPKDVKTVTIIDGTSGSRRDIQVPINAEETLANGHLTESSRHGPLPKIAPDGTRPSQAFARAVKPIPNNPNAPRVALIIGGSLGIGATGTADALRKLPAAVTLAFAPYGGNLERQVAQAREKGHELLLQLPMEPFDFPDNDPGPQTLLTSLDAGQNLDRLHWLMARFQGYVGVTNYMGGRFSASEHALGPVMREIATRGLIYFDDGSSPRSLASQIAGANNLAFAKSDLIIDQIPTPADIDRALARLETAARAKGVAIGIAGALPVSVDRIARWAKAAESRGIQLVPVSAVVAKAKSS